jgi:ABC-2 type transport system ATP-binding protein
MHDETALRADGLTKRYGSTVALQNVTLAIPSGSVTALVGPNAAGKSTLIKTFVGFERPTSGRVTIVGIDPAQDRGTALAHIGYIPQTPALYREYTVADHLDLAARLRPGFDRAAAVERLSALAIPARARGSELSGGQQAQVGLAVAIGTGADILLLDEPLASLDPLAAQMRWLPPRCAGTDAAAGCGGDASMRGALGAPSQGISVPMTLGWMSRRCQRGA